MHPEMNIRRRSLAGEELKRFIAAVAEEPNRVAADFFIFALATAARREECLQATFSEFQLEEGVWRLPANRTKTSRMRVIPLNEIALTVLARRRAETDGEFVFPGQPGKPLGNPTKAWHRTVARAGLSDLKIHDLRRSAATLLLNQGGSMTQAGNLLGHAPGSTLTATRYAFLGDEQMRDASRRLSSVISAAYAPVSAPA